MDPSGNYLTRIRPHNMGDLHLHGLPITKHLLIAYIITDILLQDLQDLQVQQESHKVDNRYKSLPHLQCLLYYFSHLHSHIVSQLNLLCHRLCHLYQWGTINGWYMVSRHGHVTQPSWKTILGAIAHYQLLGDGHIIHSCVWGYLWTGAGINHL